MKALILVLSARTQPWGELLNASSFTWDSVNHPQTETIFYCGDSGEPRPQYVVPMDTSPMFLSSFSEELKDVSARTIEALEFSLNADWDFLARPNSSCYVRKANLVRYLETLPRQNVLLGLLAFGEKGVGQQLLWGGGGYIISRDVVERFVAHKAAWRLDIMEDEAITRMAEVLEIPMGAGRQATIDLHPDGLHSCTLYNFGPSFNFSDWSDLAHSSARAHHFFRVKQDDDRTQDVMVMHKLKEVLP